MAHSVDCVTVTLHGKVNGLDVLVEVDVFPDGCVRVDAFTGHKRRQDLLDSHGELWLKIARERLSGATFALDNQW